MTMFVVLLLSACWCASTLGASTPYYNLEDAASHFEHFISKYDKEYAHEKEKEARFYIFLENLKDVNQKNNASKYTVYGITKFMDLTLEEFKSKYTGYKPIVEGLYEGSCQWMGDNDINDDAPESLDWRDYQAVGPVKDQGACKGCYTFSSTGHIEGQYAIKHGSVISLSEQQILDCDQTHDGCADGGRMTDVYDLLMQMGGIEQESAYPYQARKGQCNFDKSQVAVVLQKCYHYRLSNQEKVKQLLHKVGPISIAVDSTPLHKYTNGTVHNDECQGQVDHAVLLVGYGISKEEGDMPYWLVKNSWGTIFGENGYFKMERTEDGNSCGMMNDLMSSVDIV